MTIDALPTPPSISDPTTFEARADALLGALPTFVTQANALGSQASADAASTAADAISTAADAVSTAADVVSAANSAASAILSTSTNMTSTTSLSIPTSGLPVTRVFTTQASKQVGANMVFKATPDSSPTNYMLGNCTYSGTTLTMTVTNSQGSGTFTDWTITLSAPIATTTNNALQTKSANFTAYVSDKGSDYSCTSTFTQTLDAAATLGGGWYEYVSNDGSGVITLARTGSETFMFPGGSTATSVSVGVGMKYLVECDGANFRATRIGSARPYLKVSDQKSSATSGGSSISADFTQTRTLNTTDSNTIVGASLSSDTVTLPAGTYTVLARVPAYGVINAHKAALYNTSDSVYALIGSNANTTGPQTDSIISGKFTISTAKNFKVRHYTASAVSSSGLGYATGSGQVEVYTELEIWQESQ